MVQDVNVYTVSEVLETKELCIPYYQRPYRWHAEKSVKQLLQDLLREDFIEDRTYRLGTLLFHQEYENNEKKGQPNIVDGQQRLVTLSLILHVLDGKIKGILEKNTFEHIDSKNNLKYNHTYIKSYLATLEEKEKNALKDFILHRCNFLVITVTELGEAFQLFDSQNARGKALDPADLLKAFHLREMDQTYESEKQRLVNQWEAAIDNNRLNDVIGNYLFRLRSWHRDAKEYYFVKDKIDLFKGVTPGKLKLDGKNYPYLNPLIIQSATNYYEYNQPIVNGKWFFQYVNHYLDKVERIEEICREKDDFKLDYEGSNRIGDKRLIKLYKNVLLVYLDRFGEDEHLEAFKRIAYRWVFETRIEKKQIRFETIVNKITNPSTPIKWLEHFIQPDINAMEMKLNSIKRFEKLKVDDERTTSRRRKEFKKQGLYAHLIQLEEKK